MALSSVSYVLPAVLCSSGTLRQPVFQTSHRRHPLASRDLRFLPSLTLCTSHCVRECRSHKARFKSVIRADISENSAGHGDSGVENEAGPKSKYVATRTYRKALASLRVVGEALPLQVNAALAADGGRTAAQELAQGKPMLVIETYNPGRFSEGSTVSTKLQAPTLSVLKRAKLMPKNQKQFSSSGRAFAIAFQAVRLLKLSNFELCFFKPGTMKGMDEYKEGDVVGYLEVFDASTLSEIARGVCSYALACVKDNADQRMNVGGFGSKLFQNRSKVKQTTVESPAVKISTLTESEVLAHVETIVQEESLVGACMGLRRHRSWWDRPLATQAVVKTGVDAQLVDEFVPVHALKFKLPSNNFEAVGLQMMDDTSCTIHLTHAQMMDLADVLDLYCGDPYTGSGENVSISIDIPRRSWVQGAQAVAVGALASALGGALLLGILSIRRGRVQMETPAVESIFDMAFSQKLRELRGGEPVDEQTGSVDEQSNAEAAHEQAEAVSDQTEDGSVDLAEQTEAVDEQSIVEPVYKSPSRVQFRGRSRYYN
ncbi:hypothetical protein KC19_6G057100 [Ceratodon purpureus]|uniref:Uncharacterized protein n=1 Tax=Ceratodon purpureus TaxID=3225 RepID=A0A8T0HEW1_CERPU|nr:hypothetical protein KC19_6G057100 [Ceratodon purpureus]